MLFDAALAAPWAIPRSRLTGWPSRWSTIQCRARPAPSSRAAIRGRRSSANRGNS